MPAPDPLTDPLTVTLLADPSRPPGRAGPSRPPHRRPGAPPDRPPPSALPVVRRAAASRPASVPYVSVTERARRPPVHVSVRLPRPSCRRGGPRPGHLGLARRDPPDERRTDQAEDGSGGAAARERPGDDPARLRRPADHRVHQPQGRRGQDHGRARRGLHVRDGPRGWRHRLGQQRDPRNPRDPGDPEQPPQHDPRAARRPRPLQGRLPVPDRRPRRLREVPGRRALRRARLRRERQRHGADPRRGLQRDPLAARALLPDHPRRHRQQHAGRELAGRGGRRRPARRHLDGPRGHRLQRTLDARRPAGRGLPEPQVQDGDGPVRPVRAGRQQARRRPPTSTSNGPAGSSGCPTTRRWSPAPCCPTTSSRRRRGVRGCAPARGWLPRSRKRKLGPCPAWRRSTATTSRSGPIAGTAGSGAAGAAGAGPGPRSPCTLLV